MEYRPVQLGVPRPPSFQHHYRPPLRARASQRDRLDRRALRSQHTREPQVRILQRFSCTVHSLSIVPLIHYRYGAHLSKVQVSQLVEPHPFTLELMNSWLEHHHVPTSSISITHGGGWLTVTGVPVSQANEMLGASYQVYRPSGMNG